VVADIDMQGRSIDKPALIVRPSNLSNTAPRRDARADR
jgi:hypothetical protein